MTAPQVFTTAPPKRVRFTARRVERTLPHPTRHTASSMSPSPPLLLPSPPQIAQHSHRRLQPGTTSLRAVRSILRRPSLGQVRVREQLRRQLRSTFGGGGSFVLISSHCSATECRVVFGDRMTVYLLSYSRRAAAGLVIPASTRLVVSH